MVSKVIVTCVFALFMMSTGVVMGNGRQVDENAHSPIRGLTVTSDLIQNKGQLEDTSVWFYTFGMFRVGLGKDFIRYSLERESEDGIVRTDCWEVRFKGSSARSVEGIGPSDTTYNFFQGNDTATWITGVKGYRSVLIEGLYPGIDLILSTWGQDMKYDIVLRPGSDPEDILITVAGHDTLSIKDGELVIELMDGTKIREGGLNVFYEDSGEPVHASFELIDPNTYTFSLPEYNPTRTVRIDPVVFSTWVGGLGSDQAYGICVDGAGNSYVVGQTTARQFPVTPGAYSTQWKGSQDAYLFKMNSTGTGLHFCTLIGGSSDEAGFVVRLDEIGNIYVAGRVSSNDFPTTGNAFDRAYADGYDVFVSKFNPTASSLLLSTYVGGASSEWPQNIAIDGNSNIFVGGITNGPGFPTTVNPLQDSYGGGDIDGFLFKLNPQGTQLVYSTFIGGDQDDRVTGLVIDEESFAYISGYTRSSDFPVSINAYDTTRDGASDAYIMKVAHSGSAALYSTLFGGDQSDGIYDLAMTGEGDIVFTGITYSTDLPTTSGGFSESYIGAGDIFLTKMDINCTTVKRCTYLGSNGYERPTFINIDPFERVTITGETTSSTFPVTNDAILDSLQDSSDPFLTTITSDWAGIQYSTFLGGGMFDTIASAGSDDTGAIYTAGSTDNANFPTTPGCFDPVNNGFEDIYVLSISLDTPPSPPRNPLTRSGDGFVNLSWEVPEFPGSKELVGYVIYRGENPQKETEYASVGKVLFFNDTDVENGITFYYYIKAKNLALPSAPSLEVYATPLGAPAMPKELRCEGGIKRIEIYWTEPIRDGGSPILGYDLFRINGSDEVKILLPFPSSSYYDDDVFAGIEYGYSIEALNAIGRSQRSPVVSAMAIAQPTPPRDLKAKCGDGFVELSWSPPESDGGSELKEYNLFRSVSGGESSLLKNVPPALTRYNDTSVHNGVDFEYFVTAVNSVGESLPSAVLSTRPMTFPSRPIAPEATAGDSQVVIGWEVPLFDGGTDIMEYHVRRILEGPGTVKVFIVDGGSTEYVDVEVVNGETYIYSISALNQMGESPWSDEVLAEPAAIPTAPVISIQSFGPVHIALTWEEPSNNGGVDLIAYELHKGEMQEDLRLIATLGPTILGYNDTDVMIGETYHYTVRAVNRMGASPIESTIEARAVGRPTAPRDLVIRKADSKLVLSWSEPLSDSGSTILGYTIIRTDPTTTLEKRIDVLASSLTYIDEEVSAGAMYRYRVFAINEIGAGEVTEIAESYAYKVPFEPLGFEVFLTGGAIKLTWGQIDTSGTGAVSILVMRSVDGGASVTIAVLGPTEIKFTDKNIRAGAVYYYRIDVRNEVGSVSSNEVEVKVKEAKNQAISGAEIAFFVLGTLGPLIIAVVLIVLVVMRRKKEEPQSSQQSVDLPTPDPAPIVQSVQYGMGATGQEVMTTVQQSPINGHEPTISTTPLGGEAEGGGTMSQGVQSPEIDGIGKVVQ